MMNGEEKIINIIYAAHSQRQQKSKRRNSSLWRFLGAFLSAFFSASVITDALRLCIAPKGFDCYLTHIIYASLVGK